MSGEQLYYSSGNFAYHTDNEGRIIDNINGHQIGISNQKKNEILADYNTLAEENIALKKRADSIEALLEKHKDTLPDELREIIKRPPTVESLQNEMSELKSMIATLLKSGGGKRDDSEVMP